MSSVQLSTVGLPAPSRLGHTFPPWSPESARAASKYLDLNHHTYHAFFNDKNFHNHLVHHLLAALQLGAQPDEFPAIYDHSLGSLDPKWKLNKKPTPQDGLDTVTDQNWTQHLGKRKYYWNYLEFFDRRVAEMGIGPALDRFVFSEEANSTHASMVGRFVGGAIHPLIHCGYGAEFDLTPILAEGLALTAITEPRWGALFPAEFFESIKSDLTATGADGYADKATQDDNDESRLGAHPARPRAGLSVFGVFSQAFDDARLEPGKLVRHEMDDKFVAVLTGEGAASINAHASKWRVTADDVRDPAAASGKGGWNEKWAELVWINTLFLGATSRPGCAPKHDFFLMHTHNAVLFLPSLLPLLSADSRAKLLHSVFRASLATWIARGRPAFHIADTLYQSPETVSKLDRNGKSVHQLASEGRTRNPWLDIIEAAAQHGDEHAMKALRAQIHFANCLASTPSNTFTIPSEALPRPGMSTSAFQGLELLDGTAFARTAGQILRVQGWVADGDFHWDFGGPGFSETWTDTAATQQA
ncbi:unnamed protein product [Parajaminaea phylloscopi]